MRYIKKIGILLGIALVLQLSVLLYIEKYYLVEKKDIGSDNLTKQRGKNGELGKVKIPKTAEHIEVSGDGRYVAYYEDTDLKVVNVDTLEVSKMKFEDNTKVSLFKWVPGKERIILGGKQEDKYKSSIIFAYLDLKEKDNYKALGTINLSDKKSEASEIECSDSDNVVYVKINSTGSRNSIYRLNGNGSVEKIQLKNYSIGNIEIMKKEDKLLYEDSALNKIYTYGTGKTIDMKGLGKVRLLSVDKEDNIYIAQIENDKVKKMYWGKQSKSVEQWDSVVPKEEIDIKDIKFNMDGRVFVNNDLKGLVTEISTGKETYYKGTFLKLYSEGVASISDDYLIKTKYK